MADTNSVFIPVALDPKALTDPRNIHQLNNIIKQVIKENVEMTSKIEAAMASMKPSELESLSRIAVAKPIEIDLVDENGNKLPEDPKTGRSPYITLNTQAVKNLDKQRRTLSKQISDNLEDLYTEINESAARVSRLTDMVQKVRVRKERLKTKRGSTKYSVGGNFAAEMDKMISQNDAREKHISQILANEDVRFADLSALLSQKIQDFAAQGIDVTSISRKERKLQTKRQRQTDTRMQKDLEIAELKKQEALKRAENEAKVREKVYNTQFQSLFEDLMTSSKESVKAADEYIEARKIREDYKRREQRIYPGNLTRSGQPVDPTLRSAMDQVQRSTRRFARKKHGEAMGANQRYTAMRKDLEDAILATEARGQDVTKFREALEKIDEAHATSAASLKRKRETNIVKEKVADLKTIEEATRIEETRKKNAENENKRKLREEKYLRKERQHDFNAKVMGAASAAVGLLGPAGFPLLNVGFSTLSGGPWAGVIAAFTTGLGEGARALNNFEAELMQAADKLGAVSRAAKVSAGQLEGIKGGLSVFAQLSKRLKEQSDIEFYTSNVERVGSISKNFEAMKLAYQYTLNQQMSRSLLSFLNPYQGLTSNNPAYQLDANFSKAYKELTFGALGESQMMLDAAKKQLMKPYTSIDTDPFEVWKRIQTSALDPTKATEMEIARAQLKKLEEISAKLQEQIRAAERKANSATGGWFPVLDWLMG